MVRCTLDRKCRKLHGSILLMYFQLLRLVIWPSDARFAPQQLDFRPGMLNVITGGSRSGKSAIIPIIDYCLGASDCSIPIDTIRDCASWYGIVIQTVTSQLLIARQAPVGVKPANGFFVEQGKKVSVPSCLAEPNESQAGLKIRLNTLAGTPAIRLDDGEQGYGGALSFRDLMALVFQSQDIVANQNILFYKTHAHEHRERLRNWFPFILGAETLGTLRARNRMKAIDLELKRLKRELKAATDVSISWQENLLGYLRVADEYGLLDEPPSDEAPVHDMIQLARQAISSVPDVSQADVGTIQRSNSEAAKLERRDDELSQRLAAAKQRSSDIARLNRGLDRYGGQVRRRAERLHLSKWLADTAFFAGSCPVCGSSEHPQANSEMLRIAAALEADEATMRNVKEMPDTLTREEARLKEELAAIVEERRALQQRLDRVLALDQEARREMHRRKEMYLFIGHLRASLERYESLEESAEVRTRIAELEGEQENLSALASQKEVQKRVASATAKIAQQILKYLRTLDVEDKYRSVAPKFDVRQLGISVLSDGGNWHFLSEVGSASNWVSFHLALMCALQDYFISQPSSVVPSFVVFDQPSQVYFPRVPRGQLPPADPAYEDEDVRAVESMFKTISNSVKASAGCWQAIIMDHADRTVYGGIEGVHEVAEWRGEKKLIPQAWIDARRGGNGTDVSGVNEE
ncbi:MAG: DUF3732 domain-containing protein [Bacteroidia bacterium]|nr:DUF3732 domain-containing protein [Bacteroidia bacterium]